MTTLLVRTTLTLAFLGVSLTAAASPCGPQDRCHSVPEPSALLLLGGSVAGLTLYLRARR